MFKNPFLALALTTSLFADATMCYKENYTTPSKIETVSLDGGECNGKYSALDMKKNGWNIKDITTTKGEQGLNYTYVFSKADVIITPATTQAISSEALKQQIAVLDNEKIAKEKANKEIVTLANGKRVYENQCARCHGMHGELAPYTSKKLVGMDSEEFDDSMKAYGLNQKNSSASIIMGPYSLISIERKDVIKYLESIDVLKPVKK
ncbi:MAG: cytochrome c [Epsilonproteobacteria bacterium]|nr:cytochrome c [Campylobacterota bacterium]